MTEQEANYKAGENQNLVGRVYKTPEGEILKIESVMLWNIGHGKFEAHTFFEQDEDCDDLYQHINIDFLTVPDYIRIG